MKKTVLNLHSGDIPVSLTERKFLILKIYDKYKSVGGLFPIDSFRTNIRQYKDLREKMLNEFNNLSINIEFRLDDKLIIKVDQIVPGSKFLKDFFQCREKIKEHRSLNIDMTCYFFSKNKFNDFKQYHPEEFPNHTNENLIVLNYIDKNRDSAIFIKKKLETKLNCKIIDNECNTPIVKKFSIKDIYAHYSNGIFLTILSREFLQEEKTLTDYFQFIRENKLSYWKQTIHIILPYPSNSLEYRLLTPDGHIELVRYWNDKINMYELKLTEYQNLINDIGNSSQHIEKQITDLKHTIYSISPFIARLNNLDTILKSTDLDNIEGLDQLKSMLKKIDDLPLSDYSDISRKIVIPNSNTPDNPEFPPRPFYQPKFPASFTNEKIVKDRKLYFINEDNNPTGTHKDRFAWEVIAYCKKQIDRHIKLPDFSLISSGSAALAVQHMFNLFEIPSRLKVLVDERIDKNTEHFLQNIGCIVYKHQLEYEYLDSEKILLYTDNKGGVDITYREILDPTYSHYYDWYSYEILNGGYDYYLIPYGTGDLFSNILNVYKNEYMHKINNEPHDKRLIINFDQIIRPCFMGISTMDEKSVMDKLYSSYKPAQSQHRKLMYDMMNKFKCLNIESKIVDHIDEELVHEAIQLASELNIKAEPSGLAGLAYFLKVYQEIPKDKKIVVVNTGKTKTWEEINRFYNENKISVRQGNIY